MVRRWHADPFGFLRPWNDLPALMGSAPPATPPATGTGVVDGVARNGLLSRDRPHDVHPDPVGVVKRTIQITTQNFRVQVVFPTRKNQAFATSVATI
jgi:hypothetical protein